MDAQKKEPPKRLSLFFICYCSAFVSRLIEKIMPADMHIRITNIIPVLPSRPVVGVCDVVVPVVSVVTAAAP